MKIWIFIIFCFVSISNTALGRDILFDEIIVKYVNKPNSVALQKNTDHKSMQFKSNLQTAGIFSNSKLEFKKNSYSGYSIIKVNQKKSYAKLNDIASVIEQDLNVEYAYPNTIATLLASPNDPSFTRGDQWAAKNVPGALWMETAWDMRNKINGRNVTVAVLDTGVLPHPDLAPNLVDGMDMFNPISQNPGWDPGDGTSTGDCGVDSKGNKIPGKPSSWHGTIVSSIIAAQFNNLLDKNGKRNRNPGIAGIAYNAKILPIRIKGKCDIGSMDDLINAINWLSGTATKEISDFPPIDDNEMPQVVNISIGYYSTSNASTPHPCPSDLQAAIKAAIAKNITIVASAGNFGNNKPKNIQRANNMSPGNCEGVITVGATDITQLRAASSSHGTVVDISAPGSLIPALSNFGQTSPRISRSGWKTSSRVEGTSVAAPHVAAVAALLYGANPKITPASVKNILKTSVGANYSDFLSGTDEFTTYCTVQKLCGTGIVNAKLALSSPLLKIIPVSINAPRTTPDSYTAKGTKPTVMTTLKNDSGVNGEPITALLGTLPVNGTVVLNSDNASFTYTHDGSINITDSFTYFATNGVATSLPVLVSISILPANKGTTNTSGIFNFSTKNITVPETVGSIVLTITRTSGSSGSVTVDLSTEVTPTGSVTPTALPGFDYTNTNKTLFFNNGVVKQTITIPITVDSKNEPDEFFYVTLNNPTGGATVGIRGNTTINITENSSPSAKSVKRKLTSKTMIEIIKRYRKNNNLPVIFN